MCPYLLLLCLILRVPYALAGPHVINSKFSPLLVPTCAEACLQDFISSSFPTSACSSSDLRCLCTSRNASGFTLGEGATQCVASGCADARASDYETAYDICSGVPNAAIETHKTLSASMASPSTILIDGSGTAKPSKTTTSASLDSSATPTGILTDSNPDPIQTNFSILFSGTFTPSARSTISTASPQSSTTATATASAFPSSQPVLTTPQIAGVSVAGGAIALAALGLLLFLFCSKRRKARRDSGSSFGNDKVENGVVTPHKGSPPAASGSSAFGVRTPPAVSKAGDRLAVPTARPERGTGRAPLRSGPRQMASPYRNDFSSDSSPISVASYRTTARLLPDVPTMRTVSPRRSSSLHPGQAPKYAGGIGLKLTSPTPPHQSVADPPGFRAAPNATHGHTPSQYTYSRQPSDPFLSSEYDPREMMYAMESRRASYKDLPPLITPAYQNTRNAWSPSGTSRPPLPVPAFLPTNPRPPNRPTNPHPQNRPPQPLGPPLQFAQRQDRPPTNFSRHPSQHRRQIQPPAPPIPAESSQHDRYPPRPGPRPDDRPATHYTTTSDTDIDDEPDSSDEARDHVPHLLSPVAESPFRRRPTPPKTPLSQLRYPAIPPSRSSPRAELASFGPATPELAAGSSGGGLRSPPSTGPFELPERSTSRRGPLPRQLAFGTRRPGPAEANEHIKGTAKYQVLCTPGSGRTGEQSPRKGLTGWKTPPAAAQRGYR